MPSIVGATSGSRLFKWGVAAGAAFAGVAALARTRGERADVGGGTAAASAASGNGAPLIPAEAPPPAPAPAGAAAPEREPPTARHVVGFLFANFTGLATIAGLIVYAVVRVAYDAFYARLGVNPEAVGLTEATILGRAALYLFLFFATTAAFAGVWVLLVQWQANAYCRSARNATGRVLRRALLDSPRFSLLFAGAVAALAGVLLPLVLVADTLRDSLAGRTIVRSCRAFCEVKPLQAHQVERARETASVVEIVPGWTLGLVALAFALALVLSFALHLRLVRRKLENPRRALPLVTLGGLGLLSLAAGVAAPHFVKVLTEVASTTGEARNALSLLETHPGPVGWAVFGALLLVLGTCCVPAVAALVERDVTFDDEDLAAPTIAVDWANRILHVRWVVFSFLLTLPLVLGFLAPNVARFVQGASVKTLVASVALWLVVLATAHVAFDAVARRRVDPDDAEVRAIRVVPLVAALASLAIFVAASRGENLADQAADGTRVYARGFNILSVRANVVCLDPVADTVNAPRRQPYQHLGESGGSLVLYDYVADRQNEVPRAFPLRVPASSFVVRLANHDPNEVRARIKPWNCKT